MKFNKSITKHNYYYYNLLKRVKLIFNIKKITYSFIFLLLLIFNNSIAQMVSLSLKEITEKLTFDQWDQRCEGLAKFDGQQNFIFDSALTSKMLIEELDKFFISQETHFQTIEWIDNKKACLKDDLIRPYFNLNSFRAYVEKIVIPNDAIIAIHGDLHGDVISLNNFIKDLVHRGYLEKDNPFKIKDENFYILFLGDFVDRGWYGAEVIYTVLRLKNENPNRVLMVRGNHEDINLNMRFGFSYELNQKFTLGFPFYKIHEFYNSLPLAIYVGSRNKGFSHFIQCCHGGIELGFNPKQLLLNKSDNAAMKLFKLNQNDGFDSLSGLGVDDFEKYFNNNKTIELYNGFMWSDFIVGLDEKLTLSERDEYSGNLFVFGKDVTSRLLNVWSDESYRLWAIFRAHQQADEKIRNRILNLDNLSHPNDLGIAKLWIRAAQDKPGSLSEIEVITFSVAPATGYQYNIHAYGLLYIANDYSDWRLEAIRI